MRRKSMRTLFSLAAIGASLVFSGMAAPSSAVAQAANQWVIGPTIRGQNYSQGMPLHPTPLPRGGWYIDLPQAPGSVHYVTFRHGSLAGKSRIIMRYRIEAGRGVRIAPRNYPQSTGLITPYFQRAGDNWSARGPFESYRWYGTFASQQMTFGDHVLIAPLNANWTAVETSSARSNPRGFSEAVANADQVGFVLGGGDGYGKGVYATGPARLIITEFRVE
jgi:hypothetical protein